MDNFVVKTKQVKKGATGLRNRANYVVNTKRPEHSGTTISEVRSFKKPNLYLNRLVNERQQHRKAQGLRGGGIQNYATEFSLNLPPNTNLSDSQWKELTEAVVEKVAKVNGLDYKQLRKGFGAVIHREESKNEHCHMIIGNVYKSPTHNSTPTTIKGITQYHTTECVKETFTYYLYKKLGLDPREYKPSPENTGKNEPLWKARERKVAESYEATKEKEKEIKKLYNKFVNQYKKWEQALEAQNPRQVKRQKNRMDSTLRDIDKWKKQNDLQLKNNKEIKQDLDQYQQKRQQKEQEYKQQHNKHNTGNEPSKGNEPPQQPSPEPRRRRPKM